MHDREPDNSQAIGQGGVSAKGVDERRSPKPKPREATSRQRANNCPRVVPDNEGASGHLSQRSPLHTALKWAQVPGSFVRYQGAAKQNPKPAAGAGPGAGPVPVLTGPPPPPPATPSRPERGRCSAALLPPPPALHPPRPRPPASPPLPPAAPRAPPPPAAMAGLNGNAAWGRFAEELCATAQQLVAPGKGILAADESTGTIGKRVRGREGPVFCRSRGLRSRLGSATVLYIESGSRGGPAP